VHVVAGEGQSKVFVRRVRTYSIVSRYHCLAAGFDFAFEVGLDPVEGFD